MGKVLAPPWGVRETIDEKDVEAVRNYIKGAENSKVVLPGGETVTILKGDIKEQKGVYILIYRYQLVS